VKIAAVWPLTGPFAYNGLAALAGAKYAVQKINEAGGIKNLGGAKLELVFADAGSTSETTVSATRNVLSDGAVVAGAGSWLTSLTLASSEVAERAGVPWLVDSYGDAVTTRGFKYSFALSPAATSLGQVMVDNVFGLAKVQGKDIKTVAVVGDNTAAAVPAEDALQALLKARGVNIAVFERWAPPLADASALAQKIQTAKPDAILTVGFAFNDMSQLVSQVKARGVTAPIYQLGGQSVVPQWRDLGNTAEGMFGILSVMPSKSTRAVTDDMAKSLGQPFVQQDNLIGYALIYTIKEGLEVAGKADRQALRDAISSMEVTSGPLADLMPTHRVKFDATGRHVDKYGTAAQWQKGTDGALAPCAVLPADQAVCTAK